MEWNVKASEMIANEIYVGMPSISLRGFATFREPHRRDIEGDLTQVAKPAFKKVT
jgi:hypothetical protein